MGNHPAAIIRLRHAIDCANKIKAAANADQVVQKADQLIGDIVQILPFPESDLKQDRRPLQ
jgi:hypothetical protein